MSKNPPIPFNHELKDVSRGQEIVVICAVFTALVILATGIRIGIKLIDRVKLAIDDYLIILGLAFNLACNILEFKSVEAGFGRHLQFLTKDQERTVVMLSQIAIPVATLAIWAVKISISFFILRLIQGTHKHLRWVAYFLIAITTTSTFCQVILWGLQARPLEKLWNPEVPGTVASTQTLVDSIYFSTSILAITDLFYALSPIYFLARVQMSLKRKAVVVALTGSGLLVFTCSIVRLCFERDFFAADSSWALCDVYICTIVERNLANVIADLPAIYTLVHSWHQKILTLTSRNHTGTSKIRSSGGGLNSRFTARSNTKYNKFGARDMQDQLSSVEQEHEGGGSFGNLWFDGSGDNIPLRDAPPSSESAPETDGKGIVVQTDIDVETQQKIGEPEQASRWPQNCFRSEV